jgi:uncharacterized cupin superfamily protein
VANAYEPDWDASTDEWRRARLGEQAGAEHLGLSLYELAPGQSMVFHYHLQNEELLIVLRGRPTLRTFDGERELVEGEVVSFPRGPDGAHGFENRTEEPVGVLLVGEKNSPNVSVYPDTEEIGIFDAPRPADRRFGGRFRLADAVSEYAGGVPKIPPTA